MKSAIASTDEIDDSAVAAKQLIGQIREKLVMQAESIGILYCDADMDVASLSRTLNAELGFDVVGLTTTAMMDRHNGYNDMGSIFCVLTGDDVRFAVGCTGEMPADNYAAPVRDSYAEARARLGEDPKLILCLSPYTADVSSEHYMELLNEASNGKPVFGGVATDHYDLQYQKTFMNGQAFERGLVFVLLGGNVRPVFAMEHHFSGRVEKKGVISKSEDNSILKVGDKTFKDFVSSIVPVPDEDLVIFHFQSTPFVMELPDFEKGEQPVIRALCSVDHARGAGGFLSPMPEGSTIYLNALMKDDLKSSCETALDSIIVQMAENSDYEYSMILITSCNARHLLMGDVKNMEADVMRRKLDSLPQKIGAMGFYGFGEICPTGVRSDGSVKNRYHNISYAVCAI